MKPRYSKRTLPVPWPYITWRFHCIVKYNVCHDFYPQRKWNICHLLNLIYIKYKLHPKFYHFFQHRYLFTGRYLSVIKMDEVDRDAAIKEEDLKTTVDRECATEDNELNTNGMISD